MRKWIKQGARTVIATRDMSWANNPQTKSLLLEKARRSELVICLPKDIPLSQELKEAGAEVYTYPDLDYVLKSRFTIVRQGQAGSQVAVGMGSGSSHIIEEYQEGYHPCYAIANDLVEVIMRIRKTENVSTPARRAPKKAEILVMKNTVKIAKNKTLTDIIREWDIIAPIRDEQIETGQDLSFHHILMPTLLELTQIMPKDSVVIDCGSGTGRITRELARTFRRVIGVDMS